jgi:hypothetical protein
LEAIQLSLIKTLVRERRSIDGKAKLSNFIEFLDYSELISSSSFEEASLNNLVSHDNNGDDDQEIHLLSTWFLTNLSKSTLFVVLFAVLREVDHF